MNISETNHVLACQETKFSTKVIIFVINNLKMFQILSNNNRNYGKDKSRRINSGNTHHSFHKLSSSHLLFHYTKDQHTHIKQLCQLFCIVVKHDLLF